MSEGERTILYRAPDEEILLLGEMQRDNDLMRAELKKLPFSAAEYRAGLRLISGACLRIRGLCASLLDEPEPTAAPESPPGSVRLGPSTPTASPAASLLTGSNAVAAELATVKGERDGLLRKLAELHDAIGNRESSETNGRKRRTKSAKRETIRAEIETRAPPAETRGIGNQVLALLVKFGPLSPKQIAAKLPDLEYSQIYGATNALGKANKVESRFDESVAEKRWFVKESKK
jgi:hypothetical protein